MRTSALLTATLIVMALPVLADPPSELAAPVKILAGGEPIDVEIGHAAPFVGDLDADGLKELLVGQFGEGKLRIYGNTGTSAKPQFDKFDWFEAGGQTGRVPAG